MRNPGRPRKFDRDLALDAAMRLFWKVGYEAASISDLQVTMGGLSAPSLYAAFGSKEQLYLAAIKFNLEKFGSLRRDLLRNSETAYAGIEALLRASANAFTFSEFPKGCMLASGSLSCVSATEETKAELMALRRQLPQEIQERLERGVEEGDLAPNADCTVLARYVEVVFRGLSAQALQGSPESDLQETVTVALAPLALFNVGQSG